MSFITQIRPVYLGGGLCTNYGDMSNCKCLDSIVRTKATIPLSCLWHKSDASLSKLLDNLEAHKTYPYRVGMVAEGCRAHNITFEAFKCVATTTSDPQ